MTDTILFEQQQGIARLSFNRPDRHNALGREELDAISRCLSCLEPNTRVLMITSEGGRTFCAGADLSQISSGELQGDQFQAVTNQIAELEVPTLCVINGNVFGGGVELSVACDFRVAADDIVMRVPAAAIGLCYPIDGIQRLVARLGSTTVKRLLVGAEEFTSPAMEVLGIVSATYPPSTLMENANLLAQKLSELAPLAVTSMLSIIDQAEKGQVDATQAALLSEHCAQSRDLQEGLSARRERRRPHFRGE